MNPHTHTIPEIRYIKGIGPKRAEILKGLGIHTIRDLLYLFPRRYEDRSKFMSMSKAPLGEPATYRGEVLEVKFKPIRRRPIVEILFGDDSGTLRAVFFNQPYLKKTFEAGQQVILYGKVELYEKRLQVTNPEFEIFETGDEDSSHVGRIVPIYPLTEGLFQRSLRVILREAVTNYLEQTVVDFLPPTLRQELNLIPLDEALPEMHFPSSFERLHAARRRIIFDEFFAFSIRLLIKIETIKKRFKSPQISFNRALVDEFKKALPFELTKSQDQALLEIARGLQTTTPMNRLLQGDVGSGKTVVAAFAFLMAARSGFQSAFLIPTEILAEQHFRTLSKVLSSLNVRVELLTKSVSSDSRARIIAELKRGDLPVLVGTHALLQEDVKFKKLGFVTVDEQHKFGVHQRNHFLKHSPRPHQLVMTATPIPRTLGLTLYADLDISIMKELPKGRRPIKTYWITRAKQPEVFKRVAERLRKGEQAYIVFPIIEESEKADLLAAKKEFDRLRKTVFPEFKIGLVHGKLDRRDRESVMRSFGRGEVQVLVATSVIEVGVDQPNATMMIIENSERFGLAQLHQLRGRIGRGSIDSECFLFGEPNTEEGKKRLRFLTKLTDGFLIAEEDLKLRGQGDLLGTRQSGIPYFRVANLITDEALLLLARDKAQKIVKELDLSKIKDPGHWVQKYLEKMPEND